MSEKILLTANSVICLMAPTASGKTRLAYELYDIGRFELISVDSALIYRDMNIGTAKPTADELSLYPHHLVDIISPTENYNVASFIEDVEQLIDEIHARGKIPVLVGGTMMYYMALFEGISNVPNTEDITRKRVSEWCDNEGIEVLHNYLVKHDPITANRLNVSDRQRVTRAVEVYQQTGEPISHWQSLPKNALVSKAQKKEQRWLALAVIPDRAWLHERISKRLDIMWKEGFIDEVLFLINHYQLSANMSSMRCVGYRQVIDYLLLMNVIDINNNILTISYENNITQTEGFTNSLDIYSTEACQNMKNKALYATRQLAKRQYTWLRKFDAIVGNNTVDTTTIFKVFNSIDDVKLGLSS